MADDIALKLLQRRGVPLTNENLNRARMFVAQNPQVAEALSFGLHKTVDDTNMTMEPAFQLEAPTAAMPQQLLPQQQLPSEVVATQPQSGRQQRGQQEGQGGDKRQGAGTRQTTPRPAPAIARYTGPQPAGGAAGSAGLGTETDDDDWWRWLLPILGITATRVGRNAPTRPLGGPYKPDVGGVRMATPMRGEGAAGIPLPDLTTRIVPNSAGEIDFTGEGGMITHAPPKQLTGPAAQQTLPAPDPSTRIDAPRPISMFSDRFDPDAADALARQLQLMAEGRGMSPEVRNVLFGLSNLIAAGPQEGVLDESRAAIEALQNQLPYSRQVQIMNLLRNSPLFSQEFSAYLQPRIRQSGEVLKGALKRK